MGALQINQKIKMKNGGEAIVLDEFGYGGQGTVYKVLYNCVEYALKWYHPGVFKDKSKAFYANLENNINNGAPTDSFLWPLGITDVLNDSFGYIMNIRPDGFEELTSFFVNSRKKSQVKFKSFESVSTAAINIIQAFRELHNRGYSYQDINNGNFFINPNDGRVLICDNDNVSPYETNLGIMGKQRYMAPEIVKMLNDPDKLSDRYSLSVILFRLLFINHPLEGKYSTPPCMTKELERKYYGIEPVFIYDPVDLRNRPIPGTDYNLNLFWCIYPQYIRNAFIRAFSSDVLQKKVPRVLEKEWLDLFFYLRAETGNCPYCKENMFYNCEGFSICFECHKKIKKSQILKLKSFNLPIYPGLKLYNWHIDSTLNDFNMVVGEIIKNPSNPTLLGLKNTSTMNWKVSLPDGTQRLLAQGSVVPVKKGFMIDFLGNEQSSGKIID